jgi:CMP-N-acetylneuraminic acid synthetase/GT2 family glycosyltransferase
MGPLVSIYIPSHNYGRYLEQAIQSVQSQLYSSWELFIIDEGSDDETMSIGKYYSQRYPDKILYIRNDRPIGLQKIANYIIANARGRYIMRLDADDWLTDYAVLILQAKMESIEKPVLVYGNFFYVDEDGNKLGYEEKFQYGVEEFSGNIPPHGACTLIRLRYLKAIGGYDENVNAQDGWDMWYKLYQRGRVGTVCAPIFYYRQHTSSLSRSKERLLSARSKILSSARDRLAKGYKLKSLAVIPVQESYGDLENVPYREFKGCSLLKRAIVTANEANEIDYVIVASESESVLKYSENLEATGEVPKHYRLRRKSSGQMRSLQISEVLAEAYEFICSSEGIEVDIIACLSIHSVRRTCQHIDNAIDLLLLSGSDSVLSVQEIRDPILRHGKEGLEVLNMGKFKSLDFERERLYKFNGAIVVVWKEVLEGRQPFGESIGYLEMSFEESMIFVDKGVEVDE